MKVGGKSKLVCPSKHRLRRPRHAAEDPPGRHAGLRGRAARDPEVVGGACPSCPRSTPRGSWPRVSRAAAASLASSWPPTPSCSPIRRRASAGAAPAPRARRPTARQASLARAGPASLARHALRGDRGRGQLGGRRGAVSVPHLSSLTSANATPSRARRLDPPSPRALVSARDLPVVPVGQSCRCALLQPLRRPPRPVLCSVWSRQPNG